MVDQSLHLALKRFVSGDELHAYSYLGCHRAERGGETGYVFRVWAPRAKSVYVTGDFNAWDTGALPMELLEFGVWEAFTTCAREGDAYKFYVGRVDGSFVYKADPYGRRTCALPDTSSRIWTYSDYEWSDGEYRRLQGKRRLLDCAMNIYEVHLGSWKKKPDGTYYTYDEFAEQIIPYVKEMGYTHIQLMPIAEHPYLPSLGYESTGFYAPTHRYGTPLQLMRLVDRCHEAGIGVLLDWVPAHFPKDEYGLYEFDGTCCYELSDPQINEHPLWGTRLFDLTKGEVQSFLISNAVYWIEQFHFDGVRVDAVDTMLYQDHDRNTGSPDWHGRRESPEAISFFRKLNRAIFSVRRNSFTIAEETTAFPSVTKPDYDGGLGFLQKWNLGWTHDVLEYMQTDPLYRKFCHNRLTFGMTYAFSENFILPLSHDEYLPGWPTVMQRLPGDYDMKFSNLRTLYGFMIGQPGKKLSFMGSEFAQINPWDFDGQLEWNLLTSERHRQMQAYVRDLNALYLANSCFWNNDSDWSGFQWLTVDDCDNSVVAFRRIDRRGRDMIVVCNFCPVLRTDYRIDLPRAGEYEPIFNSDDAAYGGSGVELPTVTAQRSPHRDQSFSGVFTLAPMSTTFYKRKIIQRK